MVDSVTSKYSAQRLIQKTLEKQVKFLYFVEFFTQGFYNASEIKSDALFTNVDRRILD